MVPSILAIDIGTSSCKAAVFSEDGQLLALGKGRYSLLFPEKGQVEQNPKEIFEGVGQAIQALNKGGSDLSQVQAISFSAQIFAQCLVDKAGEPLTNLISWMDGRARKEAQVFTQKFSATRVEELTGMDMVVTPAYGVTKLCWLQKHQPEPVRCAYRFIQIKDYVIYRLTGNWYRIPPV
ncbi:xylulokinase [Marasmitruncus massiliensis]|uniref:xylulokinase n=1 Tax=Marasmitruncus massiliensis TaxID=1944642 RepID=UPI000C7D035D|nr:FGGY family carbohydrate kinase [Marasmitruncus massiliensis]